MKIKKFTESIFTETGELPHGNYKKEKLIFKKDFKNMTIKENIIAEALLYILDKQFSGVIFIWV